MEAFQQSLDALQRESNELIAQCQDAMVAAVGKGNVAPGRVAVTLAQRFTEERIASSYPVLSLLDFTLAHLAKTPPGPGQPASVALAAVLTEFWKLAPALFVFYANVGEAGLRDKVLKRLRRWKQRGLLTEPVVGRLIAAAEEGPQTKQEAPGDDADATGDASPTERQQHASFTQAQAQAFAAVLRRCTSLLEQLPSARSRPYFELMEQEHFTRPTAAAFVFFHDLLSELQLRELNGGSSSAGAKAGDGRDGEQEGGGGANAGNRAALSKLLDKLSANSGDDAGKEGSAVASGAAVLKYTSPLFSDVHLRQPLIQRPGFAALAKRRLPAGVGGGGGAGAGGADMYYPKKESTTRRPFRVPASLVQEGQGPAVRTWFPTPRAWLATEDTADAATFASRERARTMGGGWPGLGGGGGRKRLRD